MSDQEAPPPRVFISYSHDTAEHKRWVLALATTLRKNGIDAIIDAWELRAGDDVAKFMERSVRTANRVLMICTELYVAKANDGVGGVGYETTIVTGELVNDLGTAKFIPIVRQTSSPRVRPTSVSTRMYIDLSEGQDIDGATATLIDDLHDILPEKPRLGPRPQANKPSVPEASIIEETRQSLSPGSTSLGPVSEPQRAWDLGLHAAVSNDILAWRRLVSRVREAITPTLQEWSRQYGTTFTQDADALIAESMEGAAAFAPLTAVALAGVASENKKFENQIGLLEDILNPTEWQRSGYVVRTEIPETGAFLYQVLHGAMAMNVGNARVAMTLARTLTTSAKLRDPVALWRRHDIMCWPESLTRNATKTWQVALDLASRWPWVAQIFGGERNYQVGLYAYYLALSSLEYVELLAAHTNVPNDVDLWPDIPPVFEMTPQDIKRSGLHLLISTASDLRKLWASIGVADVAIRQNWGSWLKLQAKWDQNLHPSTRASSQYFARSVPEILDRPT